MQETQQSQECPENNAWFSFPALDIGPCKVIIVSYFTEQKDTAVVQYSLLFLVLHVVCYQILVSSDSFSFPSLVSSDSF